MHAILPAVMIAMRSDSKSACVQTPAQPGEPKEVTTRKLDGEVDRRTQSDKRLINSTLRIGRWGDREWPLNEA
jgi:hypothetical protein